MVLQCVACGLQTSTDATHAWKECDWFLDNHLMSRLDYEKVPYSISILLDLCWSSLEQWIVLKKPLEICRKHGICLAPCLQPPAKMLSFLAAADVFLVGEPTRGYSMLLLSRARNFIIFLFNSTMTLRRCKMILGWQKFKNDYVFFLNNHHKVQHCLPRTV